MARRTSATSLDVHDAPDVGSETFKSKEEPMIKKGRTKAKTLYGIGELEEYKSKNSGKFM